MNIYEKMYYRLYNRISEALDALREGNNEKAMDILENAQIETEEIFISTINS